MRQRIIGHRTPFTLILSAGLAFLLTVGALQSPVAAMRARGGPSTTAADWPYYGNDIGGMRYQNIDQITLSNAAQLTPAWIFHTGVMNTAELSFEAQPIEVGGTVYISSGEDHVFALDAATGALKWTYNPQLPPLAAMSICCGVDNRGVAVGGGKVFIGQLNATLVALDQSTGKVLWQTPVAPWRQNYTITMAPQYVDGKVLVGVSGGEFEIRGSLSAYDAASGKLLWRFYTVPGPGQPGHDTWAGASWKTGSAPVWDTPTVDRSLGLVYVATGNAGPDLNGSQRAGKNLYASSIVALDLTTGKLRWYFQEVHHDLWDYDGPQMTQLYTATVNGRAIPAIGHANKDGNYFMLDRRTGAPIFPVREMPVPTTPAWQHPWPTQPMPATDPLEPQTVARTPAGMTSGPMFTVPGPQPTLIQPGFETGPEWPAGAFSPRTGYVYLPSGGYEPWVYHAIPQEVNSTGSTGLGVKSTTIQSYGLFDAVNTSTGKIAWRIKTPYKALSGMAVAGDLVFFGKSTGEFDAVNAKTGRVVWSYTANMPGMGGANGSPAVYMAGGREYVVMAFGGNFRERKDYQPATSLLGDALVAFALPQPGQPALPTIVTAHPQLISTGAPQLFPPVQSPPPGAQVVTVTIHDLNFYPSRVMVRAGAEVALHLVNTGLDPLDIAVNLPTGPIGVQGGVAPGKDVYFLFRAPVQPGYYQFFGTADAKFKGARGTLRVIP